MVSLVARTSSSLTTSWATPTAPNGLISLYEVAFNPVRTAGLEVPAGGDTVASLSVGEPQMVLLATANDLEPATTYATTLSAFTSGGEGSGPVALITTAESGIVHALAVTVELSILRTSHKFHNNATTFLPSI